MIKSTVKILSIIFGIIFLVLILDGCVRKELPVDKPFGIATPICIIGDQKSLPPYKFRGEIDIKRMRYGGIESLDKLAIQTARNYGADAIIDYKSGQEFGYFPWMFVRPYVRGVAIKWVNEPPKGCYAQPKQEPVIFKFEYIPNKLSSPKRAEYYIRKAIMSQPIINRPSGVRFYGKEDQNYFVVFFTKGNKLVGKGGYGDEGSVSVNHEERFYYDEADNVGAYYNKKDKLYVIEIISVGNTYNILVRDKEATEKTLDGFYTLYNQAKK
jgi:hypothetical protein